MADFENIKRCAIYTRKSTEPLDYEFNSLDAQRESAENYIKSQKINGWELLPDHYDDGGYSGGNMERPALKRLLADVEAGKIDIIVIYKMDRLSRSLLDFMKLTEMLEQHNVSFVSVTQDINTSTSSGRMMLNILMTFGQFEREIIAERIRDKIAGAKRRGKHCGGPPVLGYDVDPESKTLIINPDEAAVVRDAFILYSQYGSATETARNLNDRGYRIKEWVSRKNVRHGGTEFTISTIYRMLKNPIYIGKVKHNGKSYPGEHEAIVDRQLWNIVRKLMKENTPVIAGGHRDSITSPFKGLLSCGHCGGSFGISYAGKKKKSGNRRYMYYLCIKDEARAERRCPLARIPVGDINQVILEQMARLLKTPSMLAMVYSQLQMYEKQKRDAIKKHQKELEVKQESIRKQILNGGDPSVLMVQFNEIDEKLERLKEQAEKLNVPQILPDLLKASDSMGAIWEELFPVERYRLAHLLFEKIQIFTDHMVIDIKTDGLKSLIKELEADDSVTVSTLGKGVNGKTVQLTVPLVIRRRHGRKVIISPEDGQKANPKVEERGLSALALHLARAHAWMELIDSGKVASITELARKIDLDKTCVIRDLHLLSLAPDIQKMVAEGREPETLSLAKLREPFPDDWEEQMKKFL